MSTSPPTSGQRELQAIAHWFLQKLLNPTLSTLQFRLSKEGLHQTLQLLRRPDLAEQLAPLSQEKLHQEGLLPEIAQEFAHNKIPTAPSFLLASVTGNQEPLANTARDFYDEELLQTLLTVFGEEAGEHLTHLTSLMERTPFDDQIVYEVYRGAHTLKGAAATVGLSYIADCSKLLEEFYHTLHDEGRLPKPTGVILTIMALILLEETIMNNLDGAALVGQILDHADTDLLATPASWEETPTMEVAFKTIEIPAISDPLPISGPSQGERVRAPRETERTALPPSISPPSEVEGRATLDQPLSEIQELLQEVFAQEAEEHISNYDAKLEALARGSDVIYDLFRITHTLKGAAATVGVTVVSEAAHKLEDFFDTCQERGCLPQPSAMPLLHHTTNLLRAAVTSHEDVMAELEGILLEASALSTTPTPPRSLPPQNSKRHTTPSGRRKTITGSRGYTPQTTPSPEDHTAARFLKVPTTSIDTLIGNSEELTLVRTQIEKSRDEFISITSDLLLSHQTLRNYLLEDRNKMSEADRLERLQELEVEIAELIYNLEHSSSNLTRECHGLQGVATAFQSNLVALRITTLELLFLKLKQAIREIAFQTGKEVEIVTQGSAVELDKGVADSLSTPLLQLVRNSVTHGVESPTTRKALAKSPRGLVTISAHQVGSFVQIKVADDGQGINVDAIKRKIIEDGLLSNPEELDHFSMEEILEAIFLPGFSTREESDEHSGRGIGLNLVREKIRRLGGDISVSTLPGNGSEFLVRVPLTTFISQALLFHLGNEVYGIPISYVHELFEYGSAKPLQPGARILWRDESIPVVPLHYHFGLKPVNGVAKPLSLLVLSHGGKYFGITCDSLVGIKDVTVKTLGRLLTPLQYFSGAIVSGAGTVQLIFNIPYLAALARPALGFKIIKKSIKHVTAPKVLVVDDSKSVREAASRVLSTAGYTIVKAQDGWEAWSLLHEEEFDLVLTDLEMPRMTGYELISEIKRDAVLQEIPVVVLSSRTGERSRYRVQEARANAFVSKPIKPLILLQVLQDFAPINEASMTRQILLFATGNKGKVRELQRLVGDLNLDIWSTLRFTDLPEVIEDQNTFEENAIKKARERARQTGLPTLADDSGLEVDALGGRPGVHSARYGGPEADDRERMEKLLNALAQEENRSARFVSVMAFCPGPSAQEVVTVRGECEGAIARAPMGEGGFGYDPIFLLPSGRTMAQLTTTEKNRISHRAMAFQQILPHLEKFVDMERH